MANMRNIRRIENVLTLAIGRPAVAIESRDRDRTVLEVKVEAATHRLVAIWIEGGWPGAVTRLSTEEPWPRNAVVVTRRFSSSAIEKLEAMGANWADETGRAHIETASGLYVVREARRVIEQRRVFRWSPSGAAIAEWLLARPTHSLEVKDLAEDSGWSHAQVSRFLQRCDELGWTVKEGGKGGRYVRRRLDGPAAMLESWTQYTMTSDRTRVLAYRNLPDPISFLRDDLSRVFAEHEIEWAASGWAGLEIAAPFATAVPVLHLYLEETALADGRLRKVMANLHIREVDEGARIEFLAADRSLLSLASEKKGLNFVSPPRLYADLRALGGRAGDAADHVREVLIGF
jgi:hypothetical protein